MSIRYGIGWKAAALSWFALRALACSCGGGNPNSCQVPVGDIIVRATVISKEVPQTRPAFSKPAARGTPQLANSVAGTPIQPEPWGRVIVTFRVSERFRGEAGDALVVHTELATESCGYPFEVGQEYLVFANVSEGKVTVSSCSATQPAKIAIARIQQLRALRDGTALPDMWGFVGTHPLRSNPTGWEQVQPVPRLTVTARSDTAEYRTQTADDGSYAFHGIPAGRYQMSVEAPPGRRAFWAGSAEHPGNSPGIPCAMNFELFWDGLISGTVLDSNGQPASGMITAQYTGPETLPAEPFGSPIKEGRFEILRLPPGRYRLMFLPVTGSRAQGPAVYYPGTQVQSGAALIEVGEGMHVEGVQFHLP